MDCSMPASLSITNSWSLLKLMYMMLVMPSNHVTLCHPLLLPSVFPSIRVFSNEPILRIRWSKYEFPLQHQSFQWIFRTDFLWDWWNYLNLIISKVSSSNTTTLGVRISINRLWRRHKHSVHNHSCSSSFWVSLLGLLTILHFRSAHGEAASGFL